MGGIAITDSKWKKLSTKIVSDNKLFRLLNEEVINPRNGKNLDTYVMECSDWVNVIAFTPDEEVILVKQFRHGVGKVTLEIPGGVVDPGEEPCKAAARELLEETGYEPTSIVSIGVVDAQPAIQNNKLHTFLALGSILMSEQALDAGEDLTVVLHKIGELPELVRTGEISHSLVLTALHWLTLYNESAE